MWFLAYNKLCSTDATSPPDCRSSTRILRSMWILALFMEFISRYLWTLWTFTQLKENTSLSTTESEDSSPEDTANRSAYMDCTPMDFTPLNQGDGLLMEIPYYVPASKHRATKEKNAKQREHREIHNAHSEFWHKPLAQMNSVHYEENQFWVSAYELGHTCSKHQRVVCLQCLYTRRK